MSTTVVQISGYAVAASWLVSIWDWLIRFEYEVAFVWPMPHRAYIKWLYFCAEYLAMVLQTVVFGIQVYLVNHPMSLGYCRIYRGVEMTVVALLMLCFDTVLLIRIYALYGLHTWGSLVATSAVLGELIATAVSVAFTIPTTTYDSACLMVQIRKSVLVFVIGTFTSQLILLCLAYRKRERGLRARVSIVFVTIRDGIVVFLCCAVFLSVLFIFILYDSSATTLMIFFLPMMISVGTCRIILNLQCVPFGHPTHHFTTEIWGPELERSADSFLLSNM